MRMSQVGGRSGNRSIGSLAGVLWLPLVVLLVAAAVAYGVSKVRGASEAISYPPDADAIPATVVPPGQRVMTAKKINLEEKVHTITPNFRQVDVMGGYTAAAGSSFIESDKLPPRLQGMAMVCEPTMNMPWLPGASASAPLLTACSSWGEWATASGARAIDSASSRVAMVRYMVGHP